jgi:hypothetical protein
VRSPETSKRAPRVDVRKAATLINSDGLEVDVTVLDISGNGFRLQVLEKLYVGELVSLRVDDELVPARIKWVLGDEAGGTFLEPVDCSNL